MDVPVAWTGASGHLLHERWIPPWIRDGLAALISELEAAAPPGLNRTRTAFRQPPDKGLPPTRRRDIAIRQLLARRFELLVAVRLVRAGVLTKISSGTPDFECSWQGTEFGIEATTRTRPEVGSYMRDLLEDGLFSEPDVEVILARSEDRLLFADPDMTAAVAGRVVTAIKERAAAAAGQPVTGTIPVPELGFTAVLHDAGPVCVPGRRVTCEPPRLTSSGITTGRWPRCRSRTRSRRTRSQDLRAAEHRRARRVPGRRSLRGSPTIVDGQVPGSTR